ncbi:hypothetical protein AKJ61_03365, partial [candidate division MSBL1 archaeon SCGC-AAA259B11]
WLYVADWLVYGDTSLGPRLMEALAIFRDRMRGLAPSERSGRDMAQKVAGRIAKRYSVPEPEIKVEDFGVAVTGRRGKFQSPNRIAMDRIFLKFVVYSEDEKWKDLLAGTVAREFQRYLSFLGGAKAPTSVRVEEAELEETGWSEEELREAEEELISFLESIERGDSGLESDN